MSDYIDTFYEVEAQDVRTGTYLQSPTLHESPDGLILLKRPTTNPDLEGQIDIGMSPSGPMPLDREAWEGFPIMTLPPDYKVRVSDWPPEGALGC